MAERVIGNPGIGSLPGDEPPISLQGVADERRRQQQAAAAESGAVAAAQLGIPDVTSLEAMEQGTSVTGEPLRQPSLHVDGVDFDLGGMLPPEQRPLTYREQKARQDDEEKDRNRDRVQAVAGQLRALQEIQPDLSQDELADTLLLSLALDKTPQQILDIGIEEAKLSKDWQEQNWAAFARKFPQTSELIAAGPVENQLLRIHAQPLSFIEKWITGRKVSPDSDVDLVRPVLDKALDVTDELVWGPINSIARLGSDTAAKAVDERRDAKRLDLEEGSTAENLVLGSIGAAGFVVAGAAGAGTGAAVGGAIGSAVPGLGTAAGAWIGGVIGDIGVNVLMSYGDTQEAMAQIPDLDEDSASALAMVGSVGASMAAHVGGQALRGGLGLADKGAMAGAKALLGKEGANKLSAELADMTYQAMKKYGLGPAGTAIGAFTKAEIHAAATMASMSAFNASIYQLGNVAAGNDVEVSRIFKETLHGSLAGMRDFLAISAVTGGRAVAKFQAEQRQALTDFQALGDLVAGVKQMSQVVGSKPGLLASIMDRFQGAKRRITYITKEGWDAFAAKEGKDPLTLARETFSDGDNIYRAAKDSGQLAVPSGQFAEKIVVAGKLVDVAQHLKWNEQGKTMAEASAESKAINEEVRRQFQEKRDIYGDQKAPAVAARDDIAWALEKQGAKPAVAKATAEIIANFLATLSAKVGRKGDTEYDAYGIWERNPLWFTYMVRAKGEHLFLNPYFRNIQVFDADAAPGRRDGTADPTYLTKNPAATVKRIKKALVGPIAAPSGAEFTVLGGGADAMPRKVVNPGRITAPALGLWSHKGRVIVLDAKSKVTTSTREEIAKISKDLDAVEKGGMGSYLLADPMDVLSGALSGKFQGKVLLADVSWNPMEPGKIHPDGSETPTSLQAEPTGGRWVDARELRSEIEAQRTREDVLAPAKGGVLATLGHHIREGDFDSDGTAYFAGTTLAVGGDTPARLVEFHELTHYADMVMNNVISSLRDKVPERLGRDFLDLMKWSGFLTAAQDLAGNEKQLTPYEVAQFRVLAARAEIAGKLGHTLADLRKIVPRAPKFVQEGTSRDKVTVEALAQMSVRSSEKIAWAFQQYVKHGTPPNQRLSEPMRRLAEYVRSFRQQNRIEPESETYRENYLPGAKKGDLLSIWGSQGEVGRAFGRFFAAEDALIEATSPVSTLAVPTEGGGTPSFDAASPAERARVPGRTGKRGDSLTSPASGEDPFDFASLDLAAQGGREAKSGTDEEKRKEDPTYLTPDQINALGALTDPAVVDAARAKLIQDMKDAEQALTSANGAKLKGERKLAYQINRERDAERAKVAADIRTDPTARGMVAVGGHRDHLNPQEAAAIKAYEDAGVQFRLDYSTIVDRYGKLIADSLPDYMYAKGRKGTRTSVTVDEVAGIFGTDADTFMLRAAELKSFKKHIEAKAQEALVAKYGAILTDPTALAALALEHAFNNDVAVQKAIGDLHALREAIGKAANNPQDPGIPEPIDPAKVQKLAMDNVSGDALIHKIQPDAVARMQQNAWRKAFEAAVNGDLLKAYEWKSKQVWFHALWLAATERRSMLDDLRADLEGKYAKESYEAKLGKADPVLRNVHNGLLELIGLREAPKGIDPITPSQLAAHVLDIQTMAWQRAAPLMFDPLEVLDLIHDVETRIPQQKANAGIGKDWSAWSYLTVAQAELIERVVKQMRHQADEDTAFRKQGERMELTAFLDGIKADVAKTHKSETEGGWPRLSKATMGLTEKVGHLFRATDAALTEPERIMGSLSESLRDAIMGDFREARGRRDRLAELVLNWWDQNWMSGLGTEARKRMREPVDLKKYNLEVQTPQGREPEPINIDVSRLDVMMIALNLGNAENTAALLHGYGWEKKDVLRMIGETLSPQELAFVQSTWDFFNKNLWPLVKEKTERQTGVPLKKVMAEQLDIPMADGTTLSLQGGYFPMKDNADLGKPGIDTRQAFAGTLGQYFKNTPRQTPYTYKGHTKPREPSNNHRLNLDFHVLSGHLVQVIHDIAFDDFVKNTGKLFSNRDFVSLSNRYLGQERRKNLDDWLWGVANGYVDSTPETLRDVYSLFNGLRNRMVVGILAHNLGVAAGDLTNVPVAIAAGTVSSASVGIISARFAAAIKEGKIDQWYEDLRNKSSVINTRSQHHVLELRQRMTEDAKGKTLLEQGVDKVSSALGARMPEGLKSAGEAVAYGHERFVDGIRKSAFKLQEFVDKYSSIVIWEAAYLDADGMAEGDRIRYADEKLEASLPHLERMLMPTFMRNSWVMSSLLLFHGYFNKVGNMVRYRAEEDIGRRWDAYKAGQGSLGDVAIGSAAFTGRTLAIFMISNVMAEYLAGRGQDKRETMGQYLARKMIAAPFALAPFGAAVGETLGTKLVGSKAMTGAQGQVISFRQAPQLAMLEQLGRLGAEFHESVAGRRRGADKAAFSMLEAYLYANMLPARQWRRSGQYLWNWATDQTHPQTAGDALSGIVYGERKNQPTNPLKFMGNLER